MGKPEVTPVESRVELRGILDEPQEWEGKEVLQRLAERNDVLVENLRPANPCGLSSNLNPDMWSRVPLKASIEPNVWVQVLPQAGCR